jgi:hypothetical protein
MQIPSSNGSRKISDFLKDVDVFIGLFFNFSSGLFLD